MELEAAEMASRQRMLGNIRFIGELYKLKVVGVLRGVALDLEGKLVFP